ncbi:MAG TPA: hypothetical protein PLU55_02305 [Candidatus Pacearchaeota archaeon]|nr:hypothetical protein [Candidatus Pacearchaeota archaeon]
MVKMTLEENPRYKKYCVYSNMKSEITGMDLPKSDEPDHKIFIINGKYDFNGLDLSSYNWKKSNTITPQQKKFLETTTGYKDYKENVFYQGPQGNVMMHLNYKTDIHKLKVNLNKASRDTMKAVKSMFELELGCICYEEDNLPEGLLEKIRDIERAKAKLN